MEAKSQTKSHRSHKQPCSQHFPVISPALPLAQASDQHKDNDSLQPNSGPGKLGHRDTSYCSFSKVHSWLSTGTKEEEGDVQIPHSSLTWMLCQLHATPSPSGGSQRPLYGQSLGASDRQPQSRLLNKVTKAIFSYCNILQLHGCSC